MEPKFNFANSEDIKHMVVYSERRNLLKSTLTDIISNALFGECRGSHSTK